MKTLQTVVITITIVYMLYVTYLFEYNPKFLKRHSGLFTASTSTFLASLAFSRNIYESDDEIKNNH